MAEYAKRNYDLLAMYLRYVFAVYKNGDILPFLNFQYAFKEYLPYTAISNPEGFSFSKEKIKVCKPVQWAMAEYCVAVMCNYVGYDCYLTQMTKDYGLDMIVCKKDVSGDKYIVNPKIEFGVDVKSGDILPAKIENTSKENIHFYKNHIDKDFKRIVVCTALTNHFDFKLQQKGMKGIITEKVNLPYFLESILENLSDEKYRGIWKRLQACQC